MLGIKPEQLGPKASMLTIVLPPPENRDHYFLVSFYLKRGALRSHGSAVRAIAYRAIAWVCYQVFPNIFLNLGTRSKENFEKQLI